MKPRDNNNLEIRKVKSDTVKVDTQEHVPEDAALVLDDPTPKTTKQVVVRKKRRVIS